MIEVLSYPGFKERVELCKKIDTFPPGVIEDFGGEESIAKYKLIGPATLKVIQANCPDYAPVDLDPSKLDYLA